MEALLEFLKVYKDYGVSGLFIALELITVYFFYKELKEREKNTVAMTERVVVALDKSSAANESTNGILKSIGQSLDKNTQQTSEFIAFIKGRDSGRSA